MSPDSRIRWLHQKILSGGYPNARLLADRFDISHRQAQRDVDYLKKQLGAPMAYSFANRGFYYTEAFTLPALLADANDESRFGLASLAAPAPIEEADAVQLQIPYTALIRCADKLAMVEFRNMVVSEEGRDIYRLEFHSVEIFLGLVLSCPADVTILNPTWLRDRLVSDARRILRNHPPQSTENEEEPAGVMPDRT